DALVGDPGNGVGDRGLDAALPALSLPAEELAAVVLDSERDPRHRETGRRSAPQAPRSLSGERVDQTLRLAALPGVALVEHFLEDAARTLRIAHVDVGPREIELRADLRHRVRVEHAALDRFGLLCRIVGADVEIDRRRFAVREDLRIEAGAAR